MKLGRLSFEPVIETPDIVPESVVRLVNEVGISASVLVAAIDPAVADTEAFCKKYSVDPHIAANCLVLEARRSDKIWYVACVVGANKSVDVNGIVRKYVNARRVSFAPMETAVALSGMEYGSITPIGLPVDWSVLVDESLLEHEFAIVGGGFRHSKIAVETRVFTEIPNVEILSITK